MQRAAMPVPGALHTERGATALRRRGAGGAAGNQGTGPAGTGTTPTGATGRAGDRAAGGQYEVDEMGLLWWSDGGEHWYLRCGDKWVRAARSVR